MDPLACIRLIAESDSPDLAAEHFANLLAWKRAGGFWNDEIRAALREQADKMRDDGAELDGAWQDKSAGAPWRKLAARLDRAAA